MVVSQRSAILRKVSPLTTVRLVPHCPDEAGAANAELLDANDASNTDTKINTCKNFLVFIETSISLVKLGCVSILKSSPKHTDSTSFLHCIYIVKPIKLWQA